MIENLTITPEDLNALVETGVTPESLADDFCDYSKVVVRKPWGYEYLLFTNQAVAVWVLYIRQGAQTSMHCHPNKKTALLVLQGDVVCSSLAKDRKLSTAQGLQIDKGVFHQTAATSEGGAFVMEIETPVNKRDLARLRDKYGREHLGYEGRDKHSINTQNYNYLSLIGTKTARNEKKRFGDCSLTLCSISGDKSYSGSPDKLLNFSTLHDEDVLCIVSGELGVKVGNKTQTYALGDAIGLTALKQATEVRCPASTEALIVRRIDNLVKVSELVVRFIKDRGTREVFVVPGDANVHLLDAIGRDEDLGFVVGQMEKGASLAAEAYSKTKVGLSFLVTSSGASGPNALPGVSNAWIDSTPLFVISGQARSDQDSDGRTRQLGNKALNITDVVKPVTKYAIKLTDPTEVLYHLEKAAFLATSGRPGPVWIDIPIDIQGMTIDQSELKRFDPKHESKLNLKIDYQQIVAMLAQARRPVIIGGNGIRLSGAEQQFVNVIERLGVPVLLSRRGADLLPEENQLFFGRPGTFGQRRANFIVQNADLILSVGCRLSIPLIGRNSQAFARAAKKIIVDIDGSELAKNTIKADLCIQADAADFLKGLSSALVGWKPSHADWIDRCRNWSGKFPPLLEGYKHSNAINPYLFIHALSEEMREDDCIVVDGGSVMHCSMQVFKFKRRTRLISSTGLELPGFALAGAIGASLALGRAQTICLCEDRGFQNGIPELRTIVDNQLPITVFVLKSKGHSAIRNIQKDFFGSRFVGTDREILLGSASISEIAKAFGIKAALIESPIDLLPQIRSVLAQPAPVICEINVDSEQELAPRMGFVVKDDGKWLAKPLEDMYPFLDRTVLQENMLIDLLPED